MESTVEDRYLTVSSRESNGIIILW